MYTSLSLRTELRRGIRLFNDLLMYLSDASKVHSHDDGNIYAEIVMIMCGAIRYSLRYAAGPDGEKGVIAQVAGPPQFLSPDMGGSLRRTGSRQHKRDAAAASSVPPPLPLCRPTVCARARLISDRPWGKMVLWNTAL